jgi:hypothetical protein
MKLAKLSRVLTAITFSFTLFYCLGADQVTLELKKSGSQAEVGLHSQMALPVSAMFPEYTIQRSTDLANWETVAGPIAGSVGVSDEFLRVAVPTAGDHAFYRVVANVKLSAEGGGGEAVYGYATEFSKELQQLGRLSLEDFVAMYGLGTAYLPQINFDPTTAEHWDQFNLDPAVHNATNSIEPRLTDFRLNPAEYAVFQTNGFVVSQRLGTYSFADSFYDIYTDDLPVFFSTDAALQAWHFSYRAMLEEVEETSLVPMLQGIIVGMQDRIPSLWAEASNTAVSHGVLDADYFLAVANSLLNAATHSGYLGQSNRIAQTLQDISALSSKPTSLFGATRWVDFSQFKVRGHYENSTILSNYFRAMMWCGFVDFQFTGRTNDNSLRELSGTVAMSWLLNRSGQYSNWAQFDRTVELFVGLQDSLNFAQLGALLDVAGIQSPSNLATYEALVNLQVQLMSGQLGFQSIASGYHFASPFGKEEVKLPRSFGVMGQRFILDSWCLSKCVFSRIKWDGELVGRRVPSALDVAFGVLGNDHIVPEIAARIARTNLTIADGRDYWRDGYPYQHNLSAVRNVVDKQNASAWTNSIYGHWLACLRELSAATTGPEYPQVMRTRAWAMKDLNTQLASWTQLRHDTVLYAKQSYTDPVLCSYPAGFVEPRPLFWQRMRVMAQRTRGLLAELPSSGTVVLQGNGGYPMTISLGTVYSNRLAFLDNFAAKMNVLQGISEKELAGQPLTPSEVTFLQNLIEDQLFYAGFRFYTGWYPHLFYANVHQELPWFYLNGEGSDKWDALVTDVHTDTFDELRGDPGGVLHQAVGSVHLLMIAVDCGPGDVAVYAGPVLSHYEFELGPDTRMTDSEWKALFSPRQLPPQPEWTRGYLVPSP